MVADGEPGCLCAPSVMVGTCRGFACESSTNPAKQRSFIITVDIGANISLEQLTENWSTESPPPPLKRQLIRHVASISRKLHRSGLNHRDYYICHFLLTIPHGSGALTVDNLSLYLIDLHRVQIRRYTPQRWILKDLAGLYFSSMDIGLTNRDFLRFLKTYRGKPLRDIIQGESRFLARIQKRAINLYLKVWERLPAKFAHK